LGDSNTIVLAAARPTEQLPLIGWRPPSAASSQAPSSGDVLTPKHRIKTDQRRKVSSEHSRFLAFRLSSRSLGLGFLLVTR
jgi:hypothetical protein